MFSLFFIDLMSRHGFEGDARERLECDPVDNSRRRMTNFVTSLRHSVAAPGRAGDPASPRRRGRQGLQQPAIAGTTVLQQ